MNRGQIPTILYLGDWDPSGENMPYAASQTLEDELGLVGLEFHRIGVNPDHFDLINADPIPIKPSDTRAKRFINRYGPTAYELDALHPEMLQNITEDAVRHFTDMEELVRQEQTNLNDTFKILDLRERVIETINAEVEKF